MTKSLIKKEEAPVSFEGWKMTRKSFIENIQTIMVSGKDYHDLSFRGKEVRVLAKGGAEKVASAFGWKASFSKDADTYEMLGNVPGLVAYVCKLENKEGIFIGEGRGARNTKQDAGDANKTIKMAQKSAFIDAVLRTSGLSDLFTQDLEQETYDNPPIEADAVVVSSGDDTEAEDKAEIVRLCKELGIGDKPTAAAYKAFVKERTGLELIPEHYATIVSRLEVIIKEHGSEN